MAADRALAYLAGDQAADGSWVPLWFGSQRTATGANPLFGTARVVRALAPLAGQHPAVPEALARGVVWLLAARGSDGGWGAAAGAAPTVEETALAVEALADPRIASMPGVTDAVRAGAEWLARAVAAGALKRPSPIGLYFASLWYSEALYPPALATAALARATHLFDLA